MLVYRRVISSTSLFCLGLSDDSDDVDFHPGGSAPSSSGVRRSKRLGSVINAGLDKRGRAASVASSDSASDSSTVPLETTESRDSRSVMVKSFLVSLV